MFDAKELECDEIRIMVREQFEEEIGGEEGEVREFIDADVLILKITKDFVHLAVYY